MRLADDASSRSWARCADRVQRVRRQHGRARPTPRFGVERAIAAGAVATWPRRPVSSGWPAPTSPAHLEVARRHVHRCWPACRSADRGRRAARAAVGVLRALGRRTAGCWWPAPPAGRRSARLRWAAGTPSSATQSAISHHYDVSNRFYEWILGPSMAYTCAVYPTADATLEEAQYDQVRPGRAQARPASRACGCSTSAAAGAAWSCTPPSDYGVHALGVTLSRKQAEWAQKAIAEAGPGRPRRGAPPRLPRRRRDRLRRGQLDRPDRAHRQGPPAGAYFRFLLRQAAPRRPAAQPLHHPAGQPGARPSVGGFINRYVFPDGELERPRHLIVASMHDTGFEVRHEENLREHYAMTLQALVRQPGRRTGTRRSREVGVGQGPGVAALPGRLAARLRPQQRSSCTRCSACGSTAPTRTCRCARTGESGLAGHRRRCTSGRPGWSGILVGYVGAPLRRPDQARARPARCPHEAVRPPRGCGDARGRGSGRRARRCRSARSS